MASSVFSVGVFLSFSLNSVISLIDYGMKTRIVAKIKKYFIRIINQSYFMNLISIKSNYFNYT